ncbi:hypothetical protein ZEAMMB73_Zm00001d006681 [Zea mays]|uniref:Glycoside hydrolase 123 catalytic domain-containing protein n=1 Tax=Zea mays TaxID=4577 RepID=A0A1D6EZK4_MAIZE|nr:hypothetical protein ZEAMMB73_Zm00001d006681 [Zea mays]
MDPSDSNSAAGGKTQNVSVPPVEGVAGGGTSYGWVDGGLRGTNIGAGVIDPTKVHSDDLLHVWSMPSTANVSQQEAPRPLEKVNLLAARNERESFQIALRPKVSWATSGIAGSVQIQCTDLCSSSGDRLVVGQSITLRRVVPILGVPDALVPIDPLSPQISIQPGETAAVWVSVNVPCGQPPGLYEGEIFITAVKTELDSRTESLPKSEKCRLYRELRSCLDLTGPRDYSSPEEMVQRLTSASTVLRRVLDNPALQDCQENNGFGDMMDEDVINNISVRLKLSLTVWDFTLPVTPSLPAVFGVSWQYSFLLCSISISVLCNCYGTGCNGLRLMGLLGPAELAATEGSVGIAAALAKPAAGTRPSGSELAPSTFEAFAKVPNVLRPHTQIFCTSEWVLGTREDLVKDIVAELRPDLGEEWWTYVCMGPSDPQPNWHLGMRGTQHRAVMWRVWKEGGTGFLYWGSNCYEKAMIPSAEICFRRGLPPGDGVLFYPGEVFSSSHEPVASTRLERILSGMQDIEYLKLYSSRYGREEGLALIEKTGMYLGPDRYTLDHGPVDVMRGEVYRTCRS